MSAKRRSTALPPMTVTGDRGIRLDVAVRVRPLNARERETGEGMAWKWEQGKEGVMIDASLGKEKHYPFHHVFDPNSTNRAVYDAIASNIVKRAVQGFNGTLFAYGQTGSGKTYSVMGNKSDPGLLPRSIDEVFRIVEGTTDAEFLLRASYLEIYNEQVHDLLQEGDGGRNLRILRDDPIRGAVIKDLTEEIVTSRRQLMDVVRRGESMRHYAATQMNANSSRSHTIYRLIIESKRQLEAGAASSAADATEHAAMAASAAGIKLAPLVDGGGDGGGDGSSGGSGVGASPDESAMSQVSYLNIVDLAGSERQADAQTAGERLREGSNINQSLLTLQICISKLSEIAAQQKRNALRDAQRAEGRDSSRRRGRSSVALRGQPKVFVPFRDSKMTRVLKQSLGGNAITAILCNMSGHVASKEETMSTLKFGTMCATIETHATKNQVMDDKTLLEQYKRRVQELTQLVKAAEEGRDEHVQMHTAQLRQEHADATTLMKEQHAAQLQRYEALQGMVLQHGSMHLDHVTEKSGVARKQRAFSAVSMAGLLHKDAHAGLGRRFSVSISASAALSGLQTSELFKVTDDDGRGIDGHSGSDAEGDTDDNSELGQLGSSLRHGGAGFARNALRKRSAGRRIVGQGAQPDASSGGGGSGGSGGDGEDLRSLRVQLSELRLQNRKQEQELADLRAEQESSVPLAEHRKEMTQAEVNLAAAMSERDTAQGLEAGLRKDLSQISALRDMLKKQLDESQQECVQARREGAKARREVASLQRQLEEAQEQKIPDLIALHAPPPADTPHRTEEAKSLTSLTPSEALARAARAEFHKRDAKAGLEAAKRALSHVKVKGANQERLVQSLQMQLEQEQEQREAALATQKAAAAQREAELMAELEALRMSSSILKQQALDVEGGSEGSEQLQSVKLELVQERQLREEAEALLRRLLPTEWERLRNERSNASLNDAVSVENSTATGALGRKASSTVQQLGLEMYRSRSFSGSNRKGSRGKLSGSDTPRGRSRTRSKSTARALAGFSAEGFGDFAELADADAPAFRELDDEKPAVDHGALAAAQVEAEMAEEAAAKIREVRAQKNEQAGWVSGTKQYVASRHDSMDSLGDGVVHDPSEVDFGFDEDGDEQDAVGGTSHSEDGWEQTWHEESQSYYYWNPSTGETRWELPTYERIQIEDHPVQKRRGRRRSTWIGPDSDEAGHQGISSNMATKTQSAELENSRQRADSETDIENWLEGTEDSSSESSRAKHAREFQASVGQHGAPEDVSGVINRVLQGEDRTSLVEWLLRHPPASMITPVVSLIHDETTRLAIGAPDDQVHAALFLLFVMLKDEPERTKERLKGSTLVSAINDVLLFGVAKGKDAAGVHERGTSLLVRRCIMILVKLSYDHAVQQDLIVRTGVVDTLKEIMEVYSTEPGILAVVECLLSNLMFQSAHNKKLICSACGEELVKVLRRYSARATRSHSMSEAEVGNVHEHKQDQALMGECVVMALRALGNLATEDVNVAELVRIGTVRTLAQAMRMPALQEYDEIVHVALDVFANLASVDVPAIRADGDGEARRAALRLHSTINADGAVEAVIEIMRSSDQMQSASFRQSALQALHNMAGGPETALNIVSTGGLSLLVELIEDKDGAMTTIEDTLAVLVAIAQHNQAREAIAHAGIDNGAERDTHAGGHGRRLVAVLMQLLANNGQLGSGRSGPSLGEDTFVIEQTLALLTELAGSDAVSRIVASEPVLACVNIVAQQHFEVPELMFCVYRLLFQLSFVPENVTVLMRAQIAQLIVSAIDHEQHGKDERLMLTCISLLGNMAVTEPSCVPALQEVDVVAKVREVMLAHRGSERVKSACQGTIVSFEAELTKAKLQDRAQGHTSLHASRSKNSNFSGRGLALRQNKIKGPNQGDSDRAKARLHHLREMSGHNVGGFSADMTSSLTSSTQSLGKHFSHQSVPSSSSMQAQFDHRAAATALDPHRVMLQAGIGVTEYEKGAQQRHLMVASDLRALIVKRKKKVKGYDAAQIIAVKKGVAKGHSRGRLGGLAGRKAGKEGCCFCITLQHETLYFETQLPTDCDRWVDALNAWRTYVASGALEDEAMVLDSLVTDAWQQRTSALHSDASARTAVNSVSSVATSRAAANSTASAESDDVPVSHGIA